MSGSHRAYWDEPVNALSNAAFILAAAAAAVHIWRTPEARSDPVLWGLTVTVAIIGTGSFLFHTFAQFWSLLADVIPISIFIYWYLGFALRRYLDAGWIVTLSILGIFIGVSFGLDGAVPPHVLNGSVGYLPAAAALFAVAGAMALRAHPAALMMAGAGLVFLVSLTFRTLDNEVCAAVPIGIHFIWHALNGLLLYLLLRIASRSWPPLHNHVALAMTALFSLN